MHAQDPAQAAAAEAATPAPATKGDGAGKRRGSHAVRFCTPAEHTLPPPRGSPLRTAGVNSSNAGARGLSLAHCDSPFLVPPAAHQRPY
jgi:hypothetical protein